MAMACWFNNRLANLDFDVWLRHENRLPDLEFDVRLRLDDRLPDLELDVRLRLDDRLPDCELDVRLRTTIRVGIGSAIRMVFGGSGAGVSSQGLLLTCVDIGVEI